MSVNQVKIRVFCYCCIMQTVGQGSNLFKKRHQNTRLLALFMDVVFTLVYDFKLGCFSFWTTFLLKMIEFMVRNLDENLCSAWIWLYFNIVKWFFQLVNLFSIGFHFLFTWISNRGSNNDFSVILYMLMSLPCFTLVLFSLIKEDYKRSKFEADRTNLTD